MIMQEVVFVLTLEHALSLDVLKGASVLSGEQGLKNEISSITVMEVPDISDWVSEGELILTTGYPYKDSPVKFVSLISSLSEKRLAGIAIKTKRFIDELPPEVLEKADELGFPLIHLPADARFAGIISSVANYVADIKYTNIKKSMEIQHSITNLIIAGGQFQEIAHSISNYFDCDVKIRDSLGNILAEVSISTSMSDQVSPITDDYERELGLPNEVAGTIRLTSYTKKFGTDERLIIDNVAKSLAVSMNRHKSAKEKLQMKQVEFLEDLALGKISSKKVLLERAQRLKINMQTSYIVYCISIVNYSEQKVKKKMDEAIGRFKKVTGILCLHWEKNQENSVIFVPLLHNIEDFKGYSLSVGQLLYKHIIEKNEEFQVKVGIGTVHKDNLGLHESYSEAFQAMEMGPLLLKGTEVYHYDEIGIYQILSPLVGTEIASRYIDSLLGKLIEHDKKKKSQLVLTLEQFIKCKSLEEAAGNLFIHPKTLVLRKGRIEKILGISLESEETKLTLLAAIMLNKINK